MDQFYKEVAIPDAEVKEYYEKHKDDFAIAEVESNSVKAEYRKSDAFADPAVRKAIFALKPGEISAPVATAKGTATYRLKSISIPEFDAARADVWRVLADSRFGAWMDEVRKSVTVTK
jgi:parvulin-like peptidyl-prolyl isomerase